MHTLHPFLLLCQVCFYTLENGIFLFYFLFRRYFSTKRKQKKSKIFQYIRKFRHFYLSLHVKRILFYFSSINENIFAIQTILCHIMISTSLFKMVQICHKLNRFESRTLSIFEKDSFSQVFIPDAGGDIWLILTISFLSFTDRSLMKNILDRYKEKNVWNIFFVL